MTTGAGNKDISQGYYQTTYNPGGSSSFSEWTDKPYDNTTGILKPARDAAYVVLGGSWRMPTIAEWTSLHDNNTFEWIKANDYSKIVTSFKAVASGYLVIKGKKGVGDGIDPTVYMFLPANGSRNWFKLCDTEYHGHYWSSSIYPYNNESAFYLWFESNDVDVYKYYYRYQGRSVRPVYAPQN